MGYNGPLEVPMMRLEIGSVPCLAVQESAPCWSDSGARREMDDNPYQTPEHVLDEGVATAQPAADERWQPSEELAIDSAIISLLSPLAAAVVPAALTQISRGSWLDLTLPPMVLLLLTTGVTTGVIGFRGGVCRARLATVTLACGGLLLNACVAYFAWLISLGP